MSNVFYTKYGNQIRTGQLSYINNLETYTHRKWVRQYSFTLISYLDVAVA